LLIVPVPLALLKFAPMYDVGAPECAGNTVSLPWNQLVVPNGLLRFCMFQPGSTVMSSNPSTSDGVQVGLAVGVPVTVGVAVGVNVGVFVGVNVGVFVGVNVGVLVGVNVGVAVGVPQELPNQRPAFTITCPYGPLHMPALSPR
jgi:hypothetical protein